MIPEKYSDYTKKFEKLKAKHEGQKFPRLLKLFDIRFRLALDMKISFHGEVSYTKTKRVGDTYALLFQLTELWNAYEVLIQWLKEKGMLKEAKWYRLYCNEMKKPISQKQLMDGLKEIKNMYRKERFAKDFNEYLQHIKDSQLKKELKDNADTVGAWLAKNENITGIAFLRLISAERNLVYHHGESAKMGSNYLSRKRILSNYIYFFISHIIDLACLAMEN